MIQKIYSLLEKFLERQTFFKTFVIVFVLLFLRSYERAIYPHLWAEDGALFLHQQIEHGLITIFESYAGYYHTVPRLVTIFSFYLFPIKFYALLIYLICTIFTSLVLSEIVKEYYTHLIESKIIRFFLAISFTFLPGLNEILGNLANIHWICFLYFAILLIREKKYSWSLFYLFILFLCAGSAGETVVLIPVVLIRLSIMIHQKEPKVIILKNLFILIFIVSFFALNYSKKQEHPEGKIQSFEEITLGSQFVIFNFIVFQPVIGEKQLAKLYNRQRTIYRTIGVIGFIFILGVLFYKKNYTDSFFLIIFLGIICIPILTFIVRPGTVYTYLSLESIWVYRYSFLLSSFGLITWVLMIHYLKESNLKTGTFILYFLFYIFNSKNHYKIEAYNKELNWYEDVKIVEQSINTGCPKEVQIEIAPKNSSSDGNPFFLSFKSKKENPCN